MSVAEIMELAERRFGEPLSRETATHIVRRSSAAKKGLIVQVAPGVYRLANDVERTDQ